MLLVYLLATCFFYEIHKTVAALNESAAEQAFNTTLYEKI